jgi:hypothetical protein
MKPRTQFLITIGVLIVILAIAWISFSSRDLEPVQIFPATINRDCAPWDGAAFTVLIPYDSMTTISISIWQSPDIKLPVTFSFPDDTGQIGFAYLHPENPLSGKVSFLRVGEAGPVEGRFDLRDENGKRFIGKFKAEWDNGTVMCG